MQKKMVLTVIGLLVLLLAANSAMAAGITFGAKSGPMQLDTDGVEDPINAGVAVGYEFGIVLGDIGLEGEFTTTVKEGELGIQRLKLDTAGAYVTYRSPGFIYLKGRAGYVGWDADFNQNGTDDDTGASYGAGLGFNLKIVKFELEYTKIDDDIDFISLGIQF